MSNIILANVNITFNLVKNPADADIEIFGATLTDMVQVCLAQTCDAAINIGGFASLDNKRLLINSVNSGEMSDIAAHEFGHILGLSHRKDGGILDYPSKERKGSGTEVLKSDVDRLRELYK